MLCISVAKAFITRNRRVAATIATIWMNHRLLLRPVRIPPNIFRSSRSLQDITLDLSEGSLQRMLRMPWMPFTDLCDRVARDVGSYVPLSCVHMDVFITLHWLSGASYLELLSVTEVSMSTLYHRINRMIGKTHSSRAFILGGRGRILNAWG